MRAAWAKTTLERLGHIKVLDLPELKALPHPKPFDAGVYFCWLNGELTYIGKSKHICERLYIQDLMNKNGHNYGGIRAKPIPWDVVTSLVLESGRECSPRLSRLLTEYERIYIATYQPPFNQDFQDGFT